MTWAPGDQAQCVQRFGECSCGRDHGPVPQFMNVYTVEDVMEPNPWAVVLGLARDGPYLQLPGFEGLFWHECFRKVEPLPPEDVDVGERVREDA